MKAANSAADNSEKMSYEVLQPRTSETHMFSGVQHTDREVLAGHLTKFLANTYALYLKTQSLHWNVVGPLFYSIHKLTEEQYTDLAQAIDEIAERIRMLGFPAPASFSQYADLADVIDVDSTKTSVEHFVDSLVLDHDLISKNLRTVVEEAERLNDSKTADMMTERIGFHEKSAWMLRAIIAK